MGFFKSNFTIIAENTTKYYLELKNRYSDRFDNGISLLAIAGVLDAQNYIFTSSPTIDIDEIFELAKESTSNDETITSLNSMKSIINFEKRMQDYKGGKISSTELILGDEESGEEISDTINILFSFIFGLEVMLFKADSPNISPPMIEQACRDKYKTIEKAITHTMNKHKVGQGLIAKATTNFMESPKVRPIRQKVGLRK